jgi:hypothetical protein
MDAMQCHTGDAAQEGVALVFYELINIHVEVMGGAV